LTTWKEEDAQDNQFQARIESVHKETVTTVSQAMVGIQEAMRVVKHTMTGGDHTLTDGGTEAVVAAVNQAVVVAKEAMVQAKSHYDQSMLAMNESKSDQKHRRKARVELLQNHTVVLGEEPPNQGSQP
jgi:hypothetical protein